MSGERLAWTTHCAALVLLGAILAVPAAAQQAWVAGGPYGGSVTALTPSPHPSGGLYAAVNGYGVFHHPLVDDARWSRLGTVGLDDLGIHCLVQDPDKVEVLYVGTDTGVYRTTDGGKTWELRNGGLYCWDVRCLAIDPCEPKTLYSGAIWEGDWRVYKTVDAGETWFATGPGIPDSVEKEAIIIDRQNSEIVYVATSDWYGYCPDDAGVYKSTNAGERWQPAGKGLLNTEIGALTMDPYNHNVLYAGARGSQYDPYGGVYVTYNGADEWRRISNGLPNNMTPHALAAVYNQQIERPTLYVAASHSQFLQPPTTWDAWLYRSFDGGRNWELASAGVSFEYLRCLATDPVQPQTMYLGCEAGGVFRTTNTGDSWAHWSEGLAALSVQALAVHPDDENLVFAGAVARGGLSDHSDAGGWVSHDGGKSWLPRGRNLHATSGFYIRSVAIAPTKPDPTFYIANLGWGLYKSTDYGKSWAWRGFSHGVSNLWMEWLAVDPLDPLVTYATAAGFTPWPPNIFKTINGGDYWFPIASGVVNHEWLGLAIDPTNTQVMYAAAGMDGMWKTANGGTTWKEISYGLKDGTLRPIVIDPSTPSTVYVGETWNGENGVYKTEDGGGKWYLYREGLPEVPVEALAIDSDPDAHSIYIPTLYAGTHGGVFRRTPRDRNWRAFSDGLPSKEIFSLAIGPERPESGPLPRLRVLYAGTDYGVARCEVGPP